MLMSLADSIRRRIDEWVEGKLRLDELLAAYAYQPSYYETQYLENRG